MLASQSSWFKDRLITTAGYRRDRISFTRGQSARVTNPSDPRVLSHQVILNEWDLNGVTDTNQYQPSTFTAGAVAHVTKRISLFYNYSKNNGLPRYDKRVLPFGETPPPTDGFGHDRGFMIDFLGDERFFLRTTFCKTEQVGDAPINPGVNNIGVDNLTTIIDALVAAGRIPRAERDANVIDYNTATIDLLTEGIEVEFVANPTRNLTLRLGYSHSDRAPGRLFSEVFDFYAVKGPEWRALAGNDAALLARINTELALIDDEITFQADRQRSPFGSRPHKLNGTARYKFTEGRLRGAFVGGAVRYQGRNFMQTDNATGTNYWGNERVAGDVFAGYRLRFPGTKIPVLLQLNIKNVSNSYLVSPGRYNTAFTGYRRIYMTEPRSYRLTTTLEF